MAERIGGKMLLGGGVLASASLTLLMPVAARCSIYMVIAPFHFEGYNLPNEIPHSKNTAFI